MITGAAVFESSVLVIKSESSVVVLSMLKVPVILPLPVPLNALIVGFVRTLFVSVCESDKVTTVPVSISIVTVLLLPLVLMPLPPLNCRVSESRSILSAVESSVAKSKSCAVTCESTYDFIALAEANVSSEPDTLDKSVSSTPDLKSATSMFEIELPVPSTSKVLLVNVSVSDAMLASSAST